MAVPLVLQWSIHSRDASMALERLVWWLYPWKNPPYLSPLKRHLEFLKPQKEDDESAKALPGSVE
jgi:hypothetical protein